MTDGKKGVAALFLAYFWWGSMPIYWKAIAHVASTEILAQRVAWSLVFTLVAVLLRGQLREAAEMARKDRASFLCLLFCGALITLNWGIYIWAVNHGHVLESSLGYFINPLVSMFLGLVFFHEKMRRLQWAALALACAGVSLELVVAGELPVISLALAGTFGLYGALKKIVRARPAVGLFIETAAMTPFALAYLYALQRNGVSSYPYDMTTNLLLAGTGVMTAVPLLLFAFSAKHVPLTTIGFVQYVSPIMTFILGTLLYGEPLRFSRVVTFAFIWAALALYSADALIENRAAPKIQ